MKLALVTRKGFNKLQDEQNYLWKTYRPEITKKVAWAASLGDRSDNTAYQYNKNFCVKLTLGSDIYKSGYLRKNGVPPFN